MVGPGVKNLGIDASTWVDHANVRPTMLTLLGLRDDYTHDGRVLIEGLAIKDTPQTLIAHRETLLRLGDAYAQVNAPFGQFLCRQVRLISLPSSCWHRRRCRLGCGRG
jgi:hypothetical protein